jgi:hypothetical protein
MRKLLCTVGMLLLSSAAAQASIISQAIPNAEIVGKGRLSFLFWDAYDAALYAPEGRWESSQPFALSLQYLREISGEDIADVSIEEIRKQGFTDEVKLAAWHSQMREIFPDVSEGVGLTGVYVPNQPTRFYKNDQEIGSIRDPEFGKYFFNIWLAETTAKPELRSQLLGLR